MHLLRAQPTDGLCRRVSSLYDLHIQLTPGEIVFTVQEDNKAHDLLA